MNNKKNYLARSLLEWAGEAGLVLTKRVQPTDQQAAAHRDNLTELDRLVKILALYPDPELWAEDDLLQSVASYTTDGSHKVLCTYADILTPYNDLADKGEGAGGIVLMPGNDNYMDHPSCGIRVIAKSSQVGMNAYTWELVTQLIALHLTKHYDPHSSATPTV